MRPIKVWGGTHVVDIWSSIELYLASCYTHEIRTIVQISRASQLWKRQPLQPWADLRHNDSVVLAQSNVRCWQYYSTMIPGVGNLT